MEIKASTLDDLLNDVYRELIDKGKSVSASKGTNIELNTILFELTNPLARLSRTETRSLLFGSLGELFWYLSGSNRVEHIEHYLPKYGEQASDDTLTVHGAYGPRLVNAEGATNQIENIIRLLREKPSSRRAVIQLFNASDLNSYHKDIPCTCNLQFLVRDNKLNLITYMRSNDAYIGLPHDIFSFTMIQEIIANTLGVEIGLYTHFVGSLHLYDVKIESAKQFLKEGYQSTQIQMPKMPQEHVWDSINRLIELEEKCRLGDDILDEIKDLDDYWSDIAILLMIHANKNSPDYINKVRKNIKHQIYQIYIDKKLKVAEQLAH